MELKNVEIIKIGELKTFPSGFTMVEFVVKTKEQYPQEIQLQANKDKAENIIKYNKVGDLVDCSINLRGRSWLKDGEPIENTKWFNTIECWKCFKAEADVPSPQLQEVSLDLADDTNDMPF